jgi:hypothetical protein
MMNKGIQVMLVDGKPIKGTAGRWRVKAENRPVARLRVGSGAHTRSVDTNSS